MLNGNIMLPFCTDPFAHAAIDCAVLEHRDEVATDLCPKIRAIQLASCAELSTPSWLSGLLAPLTVLRAIDHPNRDYVNVSSSDFTGLYRPGIVHPPHDLAALLLHLARATQPSEAKAGAHPGALRYVSTNSNNGWSSCVAAAYLHRTRGSAFHGYAVNDLKTEVSAQKVHPRLYKL